MSKKLTRGENNLFASRINITAKDLQGIEKNEELITALKKKQKAGAGRPQKGTIKAATAKRATFIVRQANLLKIQKIAIAETLTQSEIINIAIETIINRYEKTGLIQ